MAWFKRLWCWTLPNKKLQEDLREQLCLQNLPLEILLLILDHLETADGACLRLCNHALSYKLGTHFRDLFRGADRCREELLQRICRDYPQYLCCHKCLKLHNSSDLGPPTIAPGLLLPCHWEWRASDMFSLSLGIHWCFPIFHPTFHHIQMAMTRHRYGGNHGINLDCLSWTEVRTSDRSGMTTLLSVDPRIVSGELFLRVQHWMIMRPAVARTLPDQLSTWDPPTPPICNHVRWHRNPREMESLYKCKLNHTNPQADCRTCSRYLQCSVCDVEFRLDIRDLGDHGTAIIVTKWLNLGPGLSPSDWKWYRHVGDQLSQSHGTGVRDIDTRIRFEALQGQSENGLTEEHMSLSCSNSYRHSFRRCSFGSSFPGDAHNRDVWIRYPYPIQAPWRPEY